MKKIFTLIAAAAMMFAASAETVTVCEGNAWSSSLPIYGYYLDSEGTMGQMIYPEQMLTAMKGGKISQVKFHIDGQTAFYGGQLQLALKTVDVTRFETATAITGAQPVAVISPERFLTELVFDLEEPFEYNGGNLLVECLLLQTGVYGSGYFMGVNVGYSASFYHYYWWENNDITSQFLPMVTFTYEAGTTPGPQVQADAPEIGVTYGVEGNHVAYVNINSGEENATIYYSYDGENWMVYEGELLFTENGTYTVYAYVTVPGKLDSAVNAVQFVVTPRTGMTDVMTGKTIASQRYFNVAGQEMKEANGLTIVVTTYTDGTTNTIKVVK